MKNVKSRENHSPHLRLTFYIFTVTACVKMPGKRLRARSKMYLYSLSAKVAINHNKLV